MKAGESTLRNLRLDYRIVKTMRSVEGDHASGGSEKEVFQKCINLDAQKRWTGLQRSTSRRPRMPPHHDLHS